MITAFDTPRAFLREAVASALNQQSVDVEVLVIDDGSTPPLREAIADMMDQARLVYHRIPHAGLPHALIEGVKQARGDYVAILDHDDRLTPDSIRCRLDEAKKTGASLVYGDIELIDSEGRVRGRQHFPVIPDAHKFIRACLVNPIGPLKHGSMLMNRELALKIGNYDPALKAEYDLDLITRLVAAGSHRHCGHVVAQYRIHPRNSSGAMRYRMRQIKFRWLIIDRMISSGAERLWLKLFTGATLLAKGIWGCCLPVVRPGMHGRGSNKSGSEQDS